MTTHKICLVQTLNVDNFSTPTPIGDVREDIKMTLGFFVVGLY